MAIKLGTVNVQSKKPLRIIQKNESLKTTLVSSNKNVDYLSRLSKEDLVKELQSDNIDKSLIYNLYKNRKDLINDYVYQVWNDKYRELVKVINYNNLQEFYISKEFGENIENDKVLSYSIIKSEYMLQYLSEGFENLNGYIVSKDLPNESYNMLFGACAFSIYEASE